MQRLEVSGAVRPPIGVVRRQMVNESFKMVIQNSFCSVCARLQTSVSFQSERYMTHLCKGR
jgi:hypothetical protein